MEFVDVDKLEKDEEKINMNDKLMQSIKEKAKKAQFEPQKNHVTKIRLVKPRPEQKQQISKEPKEKKTKAQDNELYKSLSSSLFHVLSLPMKDETKRPILKKKLEKSQYCNKYVKENLYADVIDRYCNKHVKFGALYSYYYLNVLNGIMDGNEEEEEEKKKIKNKKNKDKDENDENEE